MLLLLPFLQFAAVDCLHIWVMKERERERERERKPYQTPSLASLGL
jgi:hypothetical protein